MKEEGIVLETSGDIAESLVDEIDDIRRRIGVDRGALIKVWLHERVQQEKTVAG